MSHDGHIVTKHDIGHTLVMVMVMITTCDEVDT